ncbi:MAG: vWA domain-containing protein [Acidimicrobiales bacterium]
MDAYQNEYLAEGAGEVNGIVTVTASGGGDAAPGLGASEIIIIDISGSMNYPPTKMRSAQQATAAAIDCIREGVLFGVIAGTKLAHQVFPIGQALIPANAQTRAQAKDAVARLQAQGGTAIGAWLDLANQMFASVPGSAINHAILLTDGKDESETPGELDAVLARSQGRFQCDCRGVGTDWIVSELRKVASTLLGTVDIVADPSGLAADFTAMVEAAMGKATANVALRVWTPQAAQVSFVKQVSPTVEDLTGSRIPVNDRVGDYPTGAWGEESRDYHVCVQVKPGAVGDEMLAARISLVVSGQVVNQALVKATWTDDVALSTRIDSAVAHYTGQAELAQAIQDGLAARKAGDDATATMKLGRAAQLASESGNDATSRLLSKVVDVEDAATGTVRLKAKVDDADEMALDTRSTKTVRVTKSPS